MSTQAQREEEKKDDEEDKVPKFVLTKYERIEFEDLLKAHTARLDALKACKAEIVKAPTPKAMTETPLEGARAQRLFCSGSRRWRQTCSVHAGRDDDPQGKDDGGQVSPRGRPRARDPLLVPHITMHLTNHDLDVVTVLGLVRPSARS